MLTTMKVGVEGLCLSVGKSYKKSTNGIRLYRLPSEDRWTGSVFSSVYFLSMDTLALMGLQVTPEVRARGPGVRLRTRFRFPSSWNIRGNSPRSMAENTSAAAETNKFDPLLFIDLRREFP